LDCCLLDSRKYDRPHRRRIWTVHWYSPGGASVHPHLLHASLGPPESKSQTASRSVQPFLHSSQQKVAILCNRPLSPFKLPLLMGDLDPHLMLGSLVNTNPQAKRHLDRFSRFCRYHCCNRQTDRPTNHATRSVTIGPIYVHNVVYYHIAASGWIITSNAIHDTGDTKCGENMSRNTRTLNQNLIESMG